MSVAESKTAPAPRLGPLERTMTMSLASAAAIGAGEPPQQAFQPGEQVSGRYRIVRFVARGGMGEVYEAEDLVLGERVALKALRAGQASERAVERFRREVQLNRRVTHPNVCRIFDVGVHQGQSFLSMEFLDGPTLSERLDRSGPLAADAAREIAEQIAAGLAAAHAEGIVHRDLKSANVMLVPSPRGGERVVVTDFGLAQLAVDDETAPASPASIDPVTGAGLAGSPAYMAPEQVQGGPITPRTDVYALAVVLFEMVTGKLPFIADTPLATARLRLTQPPPSPRSLRPELPARVDAAILRGLSLDPAARFADAEALCAALAEPPRPPRIWIGALIVAALAGGLVTAWALGGGTPSPAAAGGPARAAAASAGRHLRVLDLAVLKTGERRFRVDRALLDAWLADPEEGGKIGRLVPYPDPAHQLGFKLHAVQAGSLLDRLDLETGDVLTELAGIPLDSPDALARVARRLPEVPRAALRFQRDDRRLEIELTIVDPETPSP